MRVRTVRIPWVSSALAPCAFDGLLPNPVDCPEPGFSAAVAVELVRILVGPSARVQLLPIETWLSSVTGRENQSLWDDLREDRVDISDPFFSYDMLAFNGPEIQPIGPVIQMELRLVFREQEELVGFSVEYLLLRPSGIWFILALASLVKLGLRSAGSRLAPINQSIFINTGF